MHFSSNWLEHYFRQLDRNFIADCHRRPLQALNNFRGRSLCVFTPTVRRVHRQQGHRQGGAIKKNNKRFRHRIHSFQKSQQESTKYTKGKTIKPNQLEYFLKSSIHIATHKRQHIAQLGFPFVFLVPLVDSGC